MEFYSDGRGKLLFVGYSRFVTDDKGADRGNILTSDEQVEEWIQQYVPFEAFVRIRNMMPVSYTHLFLPSASKAGL